MTEQDRNPLEERESQAPPPSEEIKKQGEEVPPAASLEEAETGMQAEETGPATSPGMGPSKRRRKILLIAVAALAIAGAGAYLGRNEICKLWMTDTPGATVAHMHAGGETYYCPMHPDYKSDEAGNCPICSMKLVKLEGSSGNAEGASAAGSQSMPGMGTGDGSQAAPAANAVFIDPQRQQLIGIRSEPAVMKPLVKEIRAVGKVAYDETRVTHIHTKVTGYIDEVFVDYVGKVVKRGDPLFTIYSPDLVATQEEYLLALRASRQLSETSFKGVSARTDSLLEAARRRLELWDITPAQIKAIGEEGKPRRALTIYSPVSGIVTERAAYHHGRYVSPEMDLYTIVDLSTVWILGDVYEYELSFVKVGQTAEVEFPYNAEKRTLRGKITYVYPFLEEKTRTGKIRMEFRNPNFVLKPDMFVNAKLKINLGNKLVVPQDAVLDTGTQQYVFVDKGDGYFEPRPIKLGPEADGHYAIESGLESGEKVVTAANFILDSESRLKGVFANMGKPSQEAAGGAGAPQPRLTIEIVEPQAAKVGQNPVRVRVKDTSGNPVTDAEVEVTLFMPQMGSMAPMTSKATLSHAGNGEYAGTIDIQMAWSWQTTVMVKRGGQSLGSMQTTIIAR